MKSDHFILMLNCLFLFIAIITGMKSEAPVQSEEGPGSKPPVTIDISKTADWLELFREYQKADPTMCADIILYNPVSHKETKYIIPYFLCHHNRKESVCRKLLLHFTQDGVWVHYPLYTMMDFEIGKYPHSLCFYTTEDVEHFVKWQDFESFLDTITQRNKGYFYSVCLSMSNNCTIASLFEHYKLFFDRFPDEWETHLTRSGPCIPIFEGNSPSAAEQTSSDIDKLFEELIIVLSEKENQQHNAEQYVALCNQLYQLTHERREEVKASAAKYAAKLMHADRECTNEHINNINDGLFSY